jgi:hypothetical protein
LIGPIKVGEQGLQRVFRRRGLWFVGTQLLQSRVDRLVDGLPSLGIAGAKLSLGAIPAGFEILDPRLGAGEIPGIDDRKRIRGDGAEGREVAQRLILVGRFHCQRRTRYVKCEHEKAKGSKRPAGETLLHVSSFEALGFV